MSDDLDPDDWATFRAAAHRLLDQCVDHLKSARDHPWQPLPEAVRDSYSIAGQGSDPAQLADRLAKDVLPYGTGNTHPRFFGWVHGTGLATGIMSEMVADVVSNLCVFTADGTLSADSQSTLNTHIAKALQNRGHTVFRPLLWQASPACAPPSQTIGRHLMTRGPPFLP